MFIKNVTVLKCGAVRFVDIMEDFKKNLIESLFRDGTASWVRNVQLPEGFTEFMYHVGNISEMHSIIRSGLIPGGRSLKKGRQSVFFTKVKPMDDDHGMEETPCDLNNPRKLHQNTVKKVQFEGRSEERIAILSKRAHAVVLYNTLPAVCIEIAVCMKTKEELYHKV